MRKHHGARHDCGKPPFIQAAKYADRCGRPYGRRRVDAFDFRAVADDHAGAEKTDAGNDLRRNSGNIRISVIRKVGKCRKSVGTHANNNICNDTRAVFGQLPLRADQYSESHRDKKSDCKSQSRGNCRHFDLLL